jgi:NAD(P)-dependent dehydrogenase (short-subunit alcohol dehydrogenase family)
MKSYLVTGAGSGIGLAITQQLAGLGHRVYAGARRDADLAELASLKHVVPLRLDVGDVAQVAATCERISADGGRLDGLVHNAGIGEIGHLVGWSDADLLRLFEVNVFGPQRLTRELLQPLLRAQGRIVCIGSQGGSITQPLYGPYTMSKHALEAFAACLRLELAPHGVAVSIVQPGAVTTRITETSRAASAARLRSTPAPLDGAAQAVLAQWKAPAPAEANDADAPESASHRKPAAPEKVAAVVLQALLDPAPPARYLVGTRWEGDRVLAALAERLVDAAQSPSHQLTREETLAWVAREIDRR